MWNSKFLNFSRWFGTFNSCTNKNVECIKLIKLLLFEGIKANLFAPSQQEGQGALGPGGTLLIKIKF